VRQFEQASIHVGSASGGIPGKLTLTNSKIHDSAGYGGYRYDNGMLVPATGAANAFANNKSGDIGEP